MTYSYSVAIRTLGTAGTKYQTLLDSLSYQTMKPEKIIVYIAEGYSIPKETIGREEYVFVKKGMLAQRALDYKEVDSEFILFMDDDIVLEPTTVEEMFVELESKNADAIAVDVYNNHLRPLKSRVMMTISGRMIARHNDRVWGYKVMDTGGYSYNFNPTEKSYFSETNCGSCFLCRKNDFIGIHLGEETWLDEMPYALGDDQVTFYKLYLSGKKILTLYQHNVRHLDAGTGNQTADKEKTLIFCDFRFKQIFFHRFICPNKTNFFSKCLAYLAYDYSIAFSIISSCLKLKFNIAAIKINGIKSGKSFLANK